MKPIGAGALVLVFVETSLALHHTELHDPHVCGGNFKDVTGIVVLALHWPHSKVTAVMSSRPSKVLRSMAMRSSVSR
jgi:hypothetical protein